MGLVIGMDEAGYGPNFGPLVLTATVWEVPGRPEETDFWKTFAAITKREVAGPSGRDDNPSARKSLAAAAQRSAQVTAKRRAAKPGTRTKKCRSGSSEDALLETTLLDSDRLHIADSKEVYSPAGGLGPLERGALAAFGLVSSAPTALDVLLNELAHRSPTSDSSGLSAAVLGKDLWYSDDGHLPLPVSEEGRTAGRAAEKWRSVCDATGVRLRTIQSDIVAPGRWNRATRETDNKATALSRLHLQLLRRVWDPDGTEPTIVFADKHGGRNRYGDLLTKSLDGRMVWCRGESRDSSVYTVGPTEIYFEARAERHFPVALASMISKYVRELTMELFNRFWRTHLPDLKPTHGYPTDAHRFRKDIAPVQSLLGIPDEILWRER